MHLKSGKKAEKKSVEMMENINFISSVISINKHGI